MKRNSYLWMMLAALFFGFAIPACSDDDNGEGTVVNSGPIVTLSADTLFLQLDDSTQVLHATVEPAGEYEYYWSRTEPAATIDSTGTIIPLEVGETDLVYVLVESGNTASCHVVVQAATVKELTMDEDSDVVEMGDTITLRVYTWPTLAANNELLWTSSDESVAIVNDLGPSRFGNYVECEVIGVGVGTTTITATAANNPDAIISCSVEVLPSFYFLDENGNEVETLEVTIREKDESTNYQIRMSPADLEYTYTASSYPDVVVNVDENGVVSGLKGGTAYITVSALGISKEMIVTVEDHDPFVFRYDYYGQPMEDAMGQVVMCTTEATDSYGQEYHTTYQIVTVIPEDKDESDYHFTYESSDPSIATVDENGFVTVVSAGPYGMGQCIIYVTAGLTTHEFYVMVYDESMIY